MVKKKRYLRVNAKLSRSFSASVYPFASFLTIGKDGEEAIKFVQCRVIVLTPGGLKDHDHLLYLEFIHCSAMIWDEQATFSPERMRCVCVSSV